MRSCALWCLTPQWRPKSGAGWHQGLVESSAVNFYAPDVTTEEAKAYFESIVDKGSRTPWSTG